MKGRGGQRQQIMVNRAFISTQNAYDFTFTVTISFFPIIQAFCFFHTSSDALWRALMTWIEASESNAYSKADLPKWSSKLRKDVFGPSIKTFKEGKNGPLTLSPYEFPVSQSPEYMHIRCRGVRPLWSWMVKAWGKCFERQSITRGFAPLAAAICSGVIPIMLRWDTLSGQSSINLLIIAAEGCSCSARCKGVL